GDSYPANRNTILTVGAADGVLKNDTGTPAPVVTARTGPTAASGSVTLTADGGFSYTPPPNYTGVDSFSYALTNAPGRHTGTVTLAVSAPPAAGDDSYAVARDTTRVVAAPGVLANDSGFPPPSVTVFNGPTSAGGAVTLSANGGFSYTPPANY